MRRRPAPDAGSCRRFVRPGKSWIRPSGLVGARRAPVEKWIIRRKTPQEATPSGPIPIAHSPPARTLLAGPDYAAGNGMHSTSTTATAPQDLWTAALERLEPRYNKPVFEMWLKPMRLVDLTPVRDRPGRPDDVRARLGREPAQVRHHVRAARAARRGDRAARRRRPRHRRRRRPRPRSRPRRGRPRRTTCAPGTSTRATRSTTSSSAIRTGSRTPPRKRSPRRRRWRTTRCFCTAASGWARRT